MAYKPFGEKLNLDKDGKESTTAPYTNRGYTGHEHIEETNLIHMNGRVCDPTIGRFTSADPYIQAPYNTQSFNRYSYVMNNPLKYVDPSGYYADISYGYSSYSSGFTISISGFTIGGYGYGYNDYFMQQQRAQIRAAQASANAQARANAQAVAAAWQRILQAQAQTAAQTQAQAQAQEQAAAQASAQATAAQQTQLNQNLNYQSVSISSVSTNVSTIPFLISDSALLELTFQSQDYANSFNWVTSPLSGLTMDVTYGKMENPAMEDASDLFIALGVSAKLLETGIAYIGGLFESGMKIVGNASKAYSKSRPSFRKGVVDKVWENAKDRSGNVLDPYTKEILSWDGKSRRGKWDMGHIPERSYKELKKNYMDGKISKKEFLDEYNNPSNYHPQSIYSNRSRRFD